MEATGQLNRHFRGKFAGMILDQRITAIRREKEVSLQEAAPALGMDTRAYGSREAGLAPFTGEEWCRLSKSLGVDIDAAARGDEIDAGSPDPDCSRQEG